MFIIFLKLSVLITLLIYGQYVSGWCSARTTRHKFTDRSFECENPTK